MRQPVIAYVLDTLKTLTTRPSSSSAAGLT